MEFTVIRNLLLNNNLKVTPQRVAVLEALSELKNHPTTESVIDFIKINHPSIAVGTVYKILETFVEKGIINRVKTDRDVMHYDAILDKHHHLYCSNTDRIEDYFDEELDHVLVEYFNNKRIADFEINEIKVHINGKFKKIKS